MRLARWVLCAQATGAVCMKRRLETGCVEALAVGVGFAWIEELRGARASMATLQVIVRSAVQAGTRLRELLVAAGTFVQVTALAPSSTPLLPALATLDGLVSRVMS